MWNVAANVLKKKSHELPKRCGLETWGSDRRLFLHRKKAASYKTLKWGAELGRNIEA
jgi:hypothetical protein